MWKHFSTILVCLLTLKVFFTSLSTWNGDCWLPPAALGSIEGRELLLQNIEKLSSYWLSVLLVVTKETRLRYLWVESLTRNEKLSSLYGDIWKCVMKLVIHQVQRKLVSRSLIWTWILVLLFDGRKRRRFSLVRVKWAVSVQNTLS